MKIALIGNTPLVEALEKLCMLAGNTPARLPLGVEGLPLAVDAAELVLVDVPPSSLRATTLQLAPGPAARVVLVRAGLDPESGKRLCELVEEESACIRVGALAGPLLPSEITAGLPVAVLAASRFEEVNRLVVQALHSPRCRVYPTLALKDVELGGALVQVLGACLGVARGLKLGAAICAVLIARGDVEAVRLARKTAGDPVIFSGLAGVGELVASLLVPDHPAIVRGERLAAGERDEELAKLARVLLGIEPDLPLTQGIGALAAGKVTAQALLAQLMERGVRVEGR